MKFLQRFDAILFDLNGTLADDYDRFGSEQDYMPGYLDHGGRCLTVAEVAARIDDCLGRLISRYESSLVDPFPALREFLKDEGLPEEEIRALEGAVAVHEMGRIPSARIRTLEDLSATHRLGLVSDLWAPAECCRDYLESTGLTRLFGSMVFSCEHGAVKPAPRLFRTALAELGVAPADTVFVGDSATRDIDGAAACGIATIWTKPQSAAVSRTSPDRVVDSVEELADLV